MLFRGIEKAPATYLMNARGEFVWNRSGPPDAKSFAELGRHLIPGRPLRYRQLRLAVQPGDRAPDFLFAFGERRMALHRLRGRRVLLIFWKSWSTPCVKELRRLQSLQDRASPDGPLVLAVNGGEDPESLAEVSNRSG